MCALTGFPLEEVTHLVLGAVVLAENAHVEEFLEQHPTSLEKFHSVQPQSSSA